jgi:bacterioferritin-associated ferredoxin
MYVCVCHAVTDEEVRESIDAGATSVDAVTRACRAGGDCGSCHGMIEQMIEERASVSARAADEACSLDDSGPALIPASALVRASAA